MGGGVLVQNPVLGGEKTSREVRLAGKTLAFDHNLKRCHTLPSTASTLLTNDLMSGSHFSLEITTPYANDENA